MAAVPDEVEVILMNPFWTERALLCHSSIQLSRSRMHFGPGGNDTDQ